MHNEAGYGPLGQSLTAAPRNLVGSLVRNRYLIWQLAQREVAGRYRGSMFGLVWSFIHPLMMLGIYTFVFGTVFKARWGTSQSSHAEFALMVFTGMIVHAFFSECLNRAPQLIVSNSNFVKRVVFPLDALAWSTVMAALFHAIISITVLMGFSVVVQGQLHWTAVLVPLVLLPLIVLVVGVVWFLAALGVFLRDIAQTMAIISTMLMFLSPMFYPVSALPESIQPVMRLNPLTLIMEQLRAVVIDGQLPDFQALSSYCGVALLVALFGYVWFSRMRKGFADVL
ncbi:ABC transporter permease [Cupriavidus gilardii]|uniref:ABC transporter permease n=1 Tax=Cupriavidus gilardii TaxID=82541 RepID=UPI0015719587|nr:ABC transporter permease [Cupriavidus gilardii]NSX04486.1 ABC transporter permease [Cupriavidus gilardii]